MTDAFEFRPRKHGDVEPIVRAAVHDALRTGATGPALVDVLTARLSKIVDRLTLQTWLTWMATALMDLPEEARKAKMFDLMLKMNPHLDGLFDFDPDADADAERTP